jgi:hypothetical protein
MKIQLHSKYLTTADGVWLFSGSAEADSEGERVFACGANTTATASAFNTEAIIVHPEATASATHPDARVIRAIYEATS